MPARVFDHPAACQSLITGFCCLQLFGRPNTSSGYPRSWQRGTNYCLKAGDPINDSAYVISAKKQI